MNCIHCGAQLKENAAFCANCGKPVEKKHFCPTCGAELRTGELFCYSCGATCSGNGTSTPPVKEQKLDYAGKEERKISNTTPNKLTPKSQKVRGFLWMLLCISIGVTIFGLCPIFADNRILGDRGNVLLLGLILLSLTWELFFIHNAICKQNIPRIKRSLLPAFASLGVAAVLCIIYGLFEPSEVIRFGYFGVICFWLLNTVVNRKQIKKRLNQK